jgi:hypothetical protein
MGVAGERGGAGQQSGTSLGETTRPGHHDPLLRRTHTSVPTAETSAASTSAGASPPFSIDQSI